MRTTTAAAAVAAGLLLAACGGGEPGEGADSPTAACDREQQPQVQEGSHLIGEATPPVAYTSSPPTSGWHASGPARLGVITAEDPLSGPELVNVLEEGHAVAAYDPEALSTAAISALEDLAAGAAEGRLTVTPYDGDMEGAAVTLTAWGVLQRCDAVDTDAVLGFVDAHADPAQADHDTSSQ